MKRKNPIKPRRPRPGADFFAAFGAVISWNARREHWTVRRGGTIVGEAKSIDDAMTVARETAHKEPPP